MAIEKAGLGAAIQKVRLARGMTQVELAKAAGLSNTGNSVALIEQGKRFVSVDTLNALAEVLEVPPACLAVLGSSKTGNNRAATDFMQSLQELISAVILAEAHARLEEGRGSAKPGSRQRERMRLEDLARQFRKLNRERPMKRATSSGKSKSSRTRLAARK